MIIELTLLLTLTQQPRAQPAPALPPDHQVALMFCETCNPVLVRLSEAKRLYRITRRRELVGKVFTKEENERLRAALVQALGVQTEVPHVNQVRERLDWEIRRGVRPPLQRPSRY
jgi:hypothetical protein